MRIVSARVIVACAALVMSSALSQGALTHRYSINDGTSDDAVGGANGSLINGATVSGGQLVFSPTANNGTNANAATGQYMSLPSNILQTRAFTLETWVTWRGGNAWQRILDFCTQTTNADGST